MCHRLKGKDKTPRGYEDKTRSGYEDKTRMGCLFVRIKV